MNNLTTKTITIDQREFPVEGEKNILEMIRKANIDLPTFCYHSELSVYGACRLCMVDVEGRGMVPACSTLPENGMKIRTHTEEIREMRKIIVELLLANHESNCTTCAKGPVCKLQKLASKLGIKKVRFKQVHEPQKPDESSHSLVRDPNKCVLCGDCVRMCKEIQSVGAIDFAYRGAKASVLPAFGKNLDSVECVYCGQCARVCPTGALTPKTEIDKVWSALHDPDKTVIVQIAPAVRVALGEHFGLEPGVSVTGKLVSALKTMGFKHIYDTSFTADLTILEEGNELLERFQKKKNLPLFTSCCPAWVKFMEQFYPEQLDRLSTCRSPQQMFGSLAKNLLPKTLGVDPAKLVVVSLMPCTAKKYEAKRSEFRNEKTGADVDHVLTTWEIARMIEEAGIQFPQLESESFDMPFGFKTGAGILFGNSGGVTEAVLRYASEKIGGRVPDKYEFPVSRGADGIRTFSFQAGEIRLKMAVVHGLANARKLMEEILAGKAEYDFIEVMACPGGCVGGAGQPVPEKRGTVEKRQDGIYAADKMMQLHCSQDNPYIRDLYKNVLGQPLGSKSHHWLHTTYKNKKKIRKETLTLLSSDKEEKTAVDVCFGTGCFMKGSQTVLKNLVEEVEKNGWQNDIDVRASFCFEKCGKGPVVKIGGEVVEKCSSDKALEILKKKMEKGTT